MRQRLVAVMRSLPLPLALLALAGFSRPWWLAAVAVTFPSLAPLAAALGSYGGPFSLVVLLACGVSLLGALLMDRSFSPSPPLLFRRTVQEELRQRCSDRGRVEWIPRTRDPSTYLLQHPRLLLAGRTGAGRTREALELIRASNERISEHLVVPNWGPAFDLAAAQDLDCALGSLHDLEPAAVLWLDDLHRHLSPQSAERLAELVRLLQARVRLYVVGTLRSAPDSPWERRWLREQQVAVIPLPDMSGDMVRQLASQSAEDWEVALNDAMLRAIASQADRRPEQVHSLLRCLVGRGHLVPTTKQLSEALACGLPQRWEEDRNALAAEAPATVELIGALETFSVAGQVPDMQLVGRFAARRLGWIRRLGLPRAQRLLRRHPYFRLEGSRYLVYEAALGDGPAQSKTKEQATTELGLFLDHLPRAPRHGGLRLAQLWLALGLGAACQRARRYDMARRCYARAARLAPRYAPAWSAWGAALSADAQALGQASRRDEACALLGQAAVRHARAISLRPELGEAHALWGDALALRAQLVAQGGHWAEAFADWRGADEHYAQASRLNPGSPRILSARGDMLDLRAQFLAEGRCRREALAAWRDAESCYARAVQQHPGYVEALTSWGQALVHKSELLARHQGRDQALDALDEANERLARVVAAPPDDPSQGAAAYRAWGDALALRARLLAERGQAAEALAPYALAAQRYAQAVGLVPPASRERVRDRGPWGPDTYRAWGRVLSASGDLLSDLGRRDEALAAWDEAGQRYAVASQLHSGDGPAIPILYDRAEALVHKARLLAQIGRRREAAGTLAEAEPHYARLSELQPQQPQVFRAWASVLHERAQALAEDGRWEEAIALLPMADQRYAEADALQGDSAETLSRWALTLSLWGRLLMQNGRGEEALGILNRAAERYAALTALGRETYNAMLAWGNTLGRCAQLLAELGRALEASHAWGDADDLYARVTELPGSSPQRQSMAFAAWGDTLHGRARSSAKRAQQGETAATRWREALAAWSEGDRHYARAAELAPGDHGLLCTWALELHGWALLLTVNGLSAEAKESRRNADCCRAAAVALAPDDASVSAAWGD